MSFEFSLAELEAIVRDLEDGKLGLAEALARYEEGIKHLKHCYALLAQAEQKIELLTRVAEDGSPVTRPFTDESEPPPRAAGKQRTKPKPKQPADDELPSFRRDIDDGTGRT
ncbi:MAG TPA: exodeoxyribonuclease VII small subunit [Pirellulaceae bacterium]|nr:exodeoxyribonuclease VII small subunit [Pirellulaceae bacterium]